MDETIWERPDKELFDKIRDFINECETSSTEDKGHVQLLLLALRLRMMELRAR